ncbi:MAG: beta-galactosidase trimerization domain-containing protein [Planctomycetes bacterium]|nr:beta-galactosidase trimerization domain-containing protein [Planctomycetota bacterium]
MSTPEVPHPYLLDPAEEADALKKVLWASHEPLMFMRRRGGIKMDYADYYEKYHRPENVELWRKLLGPHGLERLHFHKGMGLKTEREEIDRTIAVAKKMHELGMHVSVYIGGTLHTDWFFKERPESRDWIAISTAGTPITYMGYQLWRWFPCLNNPGYRKYVKEVLDVAINEVQADEIFFDNQILRGEPRSCRCKVCCELFPKYVEGKYTPEQRIDRFGHPDVSGITPPLWTDEWPAGAVRTINDPVTQEWTDFRCRNVYDFYLDMRQYILAKKPAVAVGMNIKGLHPHNLIFDNGIDHGRWQAPGFNCCDAGLHAAIGKRGNLLAEFRAYKITHTTALTQSTQGSPLDDVLCLALNKALDVPGFWKRPGMGREVALFGPLGKFLRVHEEELFGTRPIYMDVAVLRSFPSMAYHCMNWIHGPLIAEQGLWESRIPFGIVFDQNMNTLSKHKVVLLCNQEALSDDHLQKLKRFVEAGGGLVATGGTGSRDDWRRVRVKNALTELFGIEVGAKPSKTECGKGRVAYIPQLVPAVEHQEIPLRHPYGSHGDCLAPKNWKAVEGALRWAAGGKFSFEVKAPKGVACEFREGPTPKDRVVHLLNFHKKPLKSSITVFMAAGEKENWSLKVLSPDAAPKSPPKLKKVKGGVAFTLKGMGSIYAACVLTPA